VHLIRPCLMPRTGFVRFCLCFHFYSFPGEPAGILIMRTWRFAGRLQRRSGAWRCGPLRVGRTVFRHAVVSAELARAAAERRCARAHRHAPRLPALQGPACAPSHGVGVRVAC
jgi:hypothetical protein